MQFVQFFPEFGILVFNDICWTSQLIIRAIYKHNKWKKSRFLLTVHILIKTSLDYLDILWNKCLKIIFGLPQSATNVIFYSKAGRWTFQVSLICMKVDSIIKNVIDRKLERESSCTSKKSTCTECESRVTKISSEVQLVYRQEQWIKLARPALKKSMRNESEEQLIEHARTLVKNVGYTSKVR